MKYYLSSFFLLLSIFLPPNVHSADSVYTNEYGESIILNGECLTITNREGLTIAECTYSFVNKKFIRVCSTSLPHSLLFSGMTLDYSEIDENMTESYSLSFVFPNYHRRVNVDITTNLLTSFEEDVYSNEIIEIPKNELSFIYFSIDNPEQSEIVDVNGSYPGLLFFVYWDQIPIKAGSGKLVITLPNFKYEYLFMRYIREDFMFFDNNKIIWEGMCYKKQ